MIDTLEILEELKETFEPHQAERLARLLARLYKDIANTVTKEEFRELTDVVKRLAERVDRLAEAQEKTEQRVNELAEAQRRTEESLNKLIKRVDIIEDRLEGISNSVGYSLENSAYKALPLLLKREGIEVSGRLIRRYWQDNQINIWGRGRQKGKEILILGEAKVRPSRKEIDRFIKITEEIKRKEKKEAYLIFVAHDYPPAIEEYLRHKGIRYYWSYEFIE